MTRVAVMPTLQSLVADGTVLLLVVAVLLAEIAISLRRGRAELLPGALAGLGFVAAMGVWQAGGPWYWTAAALSSAGIAHALDLRHRLAHPRADRVAQGPPGTLL